MSYTSIRQGRGELVGLGCTGIVEKLSCTVVIKSAWTRPGEEELCRREIANEAKVYELLGRHQSVVPYFGYQTGTASITLAWMANGTLRDYIESHSRHSEISFSQRTQWVHDVAQGLRHLHSKKVAHCDFSPRNILLDEYMRAKVVDFACASIDGSPSAAGGTVRFCTPRARNHVMNDIFALGSTIYEIFTGLQPYQDVPSRCVKRLYSLQQFPDLAGIHMSNVILDCWMGYHESVESAIEAIHRSGYNQIHPVT